MFILWLDPTWRLLGNVNLPSLFTQEGYSILAARCHRKKMNLFYIRPKLHMLAHEGCLVHVRFALMTHGYLYVSMWLCKYYKVGVFWNSSHWLRLRIGRNAERGLQQINPLSHLSEIFLSGHRIVKQNTCTFAAQSEIMPAGQTKTSLGERLKSLETVVRIVCQPHLDAPKRCWGHTWFS